MSSWGFTIFGILGATAILNILVAYFSIVSSVPSIEDSPYERGLDYSVEQNSLAFPVKEGWSKHFSCNKEGADDNRCILRLRDKNNFPLKNLKIDVEAKRFDTDKYDFHLGLTEKEEGIYVFNFKHQDLALFQFKFEIDYKGIPVIIKEKLSLS